MPVLHPDDDGLPPVVGLLDGASSDRPSAAAGDRTAPPEGDALSEAIRRGADALVRLRTQAPSLDDLEPSDRGYWRRDAQEVIRAVESLIGREAVIAASRELMALVESGFFTSQDAVDAVSYAAGWMVGDRYRQDVAAEQIEGAR